MTIEPNFNVSEYHHVNSYGVNVGNVSEAIHMDLYFQHGCKYVKYLMPLCVQGVLILCLWISASIFVSGARPWSHNIAKYSRVPL